MMLYIGPAVICWLRTSFGTFYLLLSLLSDEYVLFHSRRFFVLLIHCLVRFYQKISSIRTLFCSIWTLFISFAPMPCLILPTSCSIAPMLCSIWTLCISVAPMSCSILPTSYSIAPMLCSIQTLSCSIVPTFCWISLFTLNNFPLICCVKLLNCRFLRI